MKILNEPISIIFVYILFAELPRFTAIEYLTNCDSRKGSVPVKADLGDNISKETLFFKGLIEKSLNKNNKRKHENYSISS